MTESLPPITDAEPEPDEPRRRRRGLVRLGLGVVVVAVAGVGSWLWVSDASTEPAPAAAGPVATAEVTRATLTATETWDGTLGRGSPFTVVAQGTGSSSESESESSSPSATVTRLPDQGATVEQGDELYRVNEQPVTLLLGAIPMYRDLAPGDSGRDVKQLERNLAKLGYGGFTADDEYTFSTADAVRAWQEDIGAEQTGTVARDDVVFVPKGGQVDTLHVSVGDTLSPGSPVLDITGADQVVSLEVDVDDRDRFEVDTEVTVVLPGGDEVAGTVSATAVVEVVSEEEDTESIVQAEVTLNEKAPEEFIGAPVDVIVGVDERTDVLTVPVNALLALAEGGYGLEVVRDDGSTEIVAVETGLFAEGRVEVSGADIAAGTVVGVAGR